MTALTLCILAAMHYPAPQAARACALAPWAVDAATEARTWTREPVTPGLMLAVAYVETRWTVGLVNAGGYAGPWQCHPRWTGLTAAELQGQPGAMAAGRILGRFARRGGGLREALRRYSGSGKGRYAYADAVLRESARLAKKP